LKQKSDAVEDRKTSVIEVLHNRIVEVERQHELEMRDPHRSELLHLFFKSSFTTEYGSMEEVDPSR
jgi:hypothetical protein